MGSVTTFVAWLVDAILNLSVHLAVVCFGLTVFQIIRGRLIGAFWALAPAAGLVVWILAGQSQPLEHGPGGRGTPLRVMSFNILVFNDDYDQKLGFIRGRNADVVLVQETNPRWWGRFQALRDLYPHMRRAGPIGVLVFSKHPLGEIQDTILQPWPEHLDRPSYLGPGQGIIRALVVPMRLPMGEGREQAVTLISFHATRSLLPAGYAARARDLERLAAFVNAVEGPVIAGGDLNGTPLSPAIRSFLAEAGLKGLPSAPWRPLGTWPKMLPEVAGFQIDHLLAKGPVSVRDYQVLADASSNHRAVLADFVIAP